MTTKPSSIGQWVGAVIAAVVIIGASFLGFHAFNARAHANAELQSGAQSPQSDSIAQSGSQSGDTPQSAEPTPVDVPKPTPPTHLHREGQIGAQATAQYYLELRAYSINMGDTEDYMKICDEGESCSAFDTDVHTLHADRIVTQPISMKYLMTKQVWECTDRYDGTSGTCIKFDYSSVTGRAVRKDNTADNPQYSTIGLSNNKTESTLHYEGIMLLAYEGDTWVVKRVWSQKE
mgnify:FL=1